MRQSEYMQRNPVRLDISRSRWDMNPRWTGTFESYRLVPIFTYSDIMPGDTFKLSTSFVLRMSTPIAPVMDDLFLDVAFYFVPHELILSRSYMSPSTNDSNHSWKAFIGAQDSLLNMPIPDGDVELPLLVVANNAPGRYLVGGIADCMGLGVPTEGDWYQINPLAFLAFMAVWNENYREPNTQNPGVFSIVNNNVRVTWDAVGVDSNNPSIFSMWMLPNVCRFHGYFGSALPWPQRNSETVKMPLGTTAPLTVQSDPYALGGKVYLGDVNESGSPTQIPEATALGIGSGSLLGGTYDEAEPGFESSYVRSTNLVANLAQASAVSINTFRLAVQEQRWYEALARGGNRIDELTASLFGVMPKDAGGNQPEYLGGKRIPISVSQVNVTANSAAGSQNNGVGDTGAFSVTSDVDYYFTKSFDKWGTMLGVACVRYRDSFGNSINKQFTRFKRFDWYFPQFANLGEQPVYIHELDATLLSSSEGKPSSDVFGYQEAWADFRYIPDVVTGLVRPGKSLQHWTYANNYNATSGKLAAFLQGYGAKSSIDRSLIVSSETSGLQFLGQFQFNITAVRAMPLHSIPGLVDHH